MLVRSIPFIIAGLAVALGFKAGLFNIGAEGQLYAGGIFAVWVGFSPIFANLPLIIHLPLALVVGIIGGALWGAIPGALKAFTGAHEVIVTIMLNYVAVLLVDWLIKSTNPVILLDPTASTPRTPFIVDSRRASRRSTPSRHGASSPPGSSCWRSACMRGASGFSRTCASPFARSSTAC